MTILINILKITFLFFICFDSMASQNLKKFDIKIIAPSSGCEASIWDKAFQLTGDRCKKRTLSSDDQVFANQADKFTDLDAALKSNHKVLWALKGGYGADKLLGKVSTTDYSNVSKKILIGYSDITNLLVYFSQKYNWVCLSAPMLKDLILKNKSQQSYKTVLNFLGNTNITLRIPALTPLNSSAKNANTISGKTTGGNLTCLVSGIGTPWQIQTSHKILFLEDVNVCGYHLDRLMTHLKNAKILENVKAIIFGDFGQDVSKILKTFANQLNIPVYSTNYFGHQTHNYCWGYDFCGTITKTSGKFSISMKR